MTDAVEAARKELFTYLDGRETMMPSFAVRVDAYRDALLAQPTQHEQTAPPMTREEALKTALTIVTGMATNTRGYMDGATFTSRVDAVERYARFLLGETADDE